MHRNLKLSIILFLAVSLYPAVTGLKANFSKGKTYVTFNEESGGNHTYNVYRSKSAITNVADMVPYTNLRDSSSYDYGWRRYWAVTDTGPLLNSGIGLLVYTPKETSDVYYAVTIVRNGVEDKTITVGENSTAQAVHEEWWKWPLGVLQEIDTKSYYEASNYKYYFWMDYDDWNHDYCYYGDLFALGVNYRVQNSMNSGSPQPLSVSLHSAFQDGYSSAVSSGNSTAAAILGFRSHALPFNNQTWWFGWSKTWKFKNPPTDSSLNRPAKGDTIVNYAEMRIMAYIHSILGENRFKIDTNRMYLSGVSMGGSGTLINAVHKPNFFAAVKGIVPAVKFQYCWYFSAVPNHWGLQSDSLTARNGIYIYDWNDAGWMIGRDATVTMTPMLIASGVKDSGMPLWMHRWLYFNCAKSKQGVFGLWKNVGHDIIGDEPLSGGMMRFKRNEWYPAFVNASRDDEYGQSHPDKNSPPAGTLPFTSMAHDTAGTMNGYLDWSSSLHDLALANDSLVDCPDSLMITMKTSRESTLVDITPRRVQKFPIVKGSNYVWQNYSTANSALISEGKFSPDTNGLLTVPRVLILTSGSRLLIKREGGTDAEIKTSENLRMLITATPNPFTNNTTFNFSASVKTVSVFDLRGRCVLKLSEKEIKGNSYFWNAKQLSAGVYSVVGKAKDNTILKTRITLLK
ncbi:MAG: T9SS type A sorting domain-containing protein [Fibrobacteres bacterium]|nr:T9SS type A sorting domain-containing protein [Fibrobacterota bacterium]